jgi:hypothetical protein
LVPNGPPGRSSLLYDALQEHLPDCSIWDEQKRLRTLVDDAVLGRQAMEDRLTAETTAAGLGPDARALLSRRAHAASDGEAVSFPDEPWWIDYAPWALGAGTGSRVSTTDKQPLNLGTMEIAIVETFDAAQQVIGVVHDIWNAIPNWSEVLRIRHAERELPGAREVLDRHIAELELHPQFPGRCRLCTSRVV